VPLDPPEPPVAARRRHRSQQRARILAWLRDTDLHPTAAQIHEALLRELPQLSLGTVYRNLEVLVAEGEVVEVLAPGRPARYDAHLEPHQHFWCDACGRVVDVAIPAPRGLARRLVTDHGLVARRIHVSFHGLCTACEPEALEERSGPSSSRRRGPASDRSPTRHVRTGGKEGRWPI
jgi:Fe2+ or Zn2+ uptake regulation protein